MKRIFSASFLVISFALAFGCQPPPDETQSLEVATTGPEAQTQELSKLSESDWCVVEAQGAAFDRDAAVTVSYLKEGYALLKSIRAQGSGQAVIEEGTAATWEVQGDLLRVTDLFSGEVNERKISFVEHEIKDANSSLWSAGVKSGTQTCLRLEDPADPTSSEIHCACEIHKIWEHHETLTP